MAAHDGANAIIEMPAICVAYIAKNAFEAVTRVGLAVEIAMCCVLLSFGQVKFLIDLGANFFVHIG